MDNLGVKFVAMLAAILCTVIGFDHIPSQTGQGGFSYLPANTSGNFSFDNCRANTTLYFKGVNISPDPILFDREKESTITISISYELQKTISKKLPIEVDIRLSLVAGAQGYTELCDLIGEEYCHYNLNKWLEMYPIPLTQGSHDLGPFNYTKLEPMPFILRGRFDATLYIKQQGQHIGCLRIRFCVTECMF